MHYDSRMCDKAVNRCFFVFNSIPNRYKTQEMCDRVVSDDLFLIVYCPDKYISQKLSDEAVDDSIRTLKLIPNCFVTGEMIKNFLLLCTQMKIYSHFNEGSGDAIFNCSGMGILNIDLNSISLDNNFDEDDPGTIIPTRLLA